MVFLPNPYSVLIVSHNDSLRQNLAPLLPAGEFEPVCTARSAAEARRGLLQREFDLILINTPLQDGQGVELAEELCAQTEAGVLLLVRSEVYEEVTARVQSSGVMTLNKPGSRQLAAHSLQALCAVRERLRTRSRVQSTVEKKIQELRLIDRAKWRLIETRHMTEPEAHIALERIAMERRVTKIQAAQDILAGGGAEDTDVPEPQV